MALTAPAVAEEAPRERFAFTDDPVLTRLIDEALAQRPELSQARTLVEAERERGPQDSAFPDPVLTFGIQNDSFTRIQIGEMETSWVTLMVSQTVPWYGKRGLRADIAGLAVQQAQTQLERVRLSVRAEVETAYVDLLLIRDQLTLLGKLEVLWSLSEGLVKTRYESGDGAQSDLLRAQLERSRLSQRRWALEAEDRRRLASLNRLRGRLLTDPVSTLRSLNDAADPAPLDLSPDLEAQSPEVQSAALAVGELEKKVTLARREFFPDPTLSAGVMPRGKLEPMWQLGVSFGIPVWGGSRQSHAVTENGLRQRAAVDGAAAIRLLLHQRMLERAVVLDALLKTNRLYRDGLLVLSESTVTSTLAQYQVGRVTFASVLEALIGYVADVNGFLESAAAAQRIAIAHRALSLDPASGPSPGVMGGAVPGAGAMTSGSSRAGPAVPAAVSAGAAQPGM